MPDLLLELFGEEIPARMQARAAEDLARLVGAKLAERQIAAGAIRCYVTPRRLALVADALPERQPGRVIETKGPREGAPAPAIAGFLRSAGLQSLDQTELRDTGKARFHFAVTRVEGQTIDLALAEILGEVLDGFPWPKSMRWAGHDRRWVRPLHNILALLSGPEGRRVVPLRWSLDRDAATPSTLDANPCTFGHRFLAPERLTVESFADYQAQLRIASVIIDPQERKRIILEEGAALARDLGLRVRDDAALLDEVAGLVEYPVVQLGRIEQRFMALPAEVLTTSMRSHQKYFACERDDGALAPYFIFVANTKTRDGGARIIAGNERVLRARLWDAQFFWDLDRKSTLASRIDKLKERVFHAKLGSVHDKIARMVELAKRLVEFVPGADFNHAMDAVRLAKADLSSALVGEFPELQGVMGRYLALNDGLPPDVADAIGRHYAPAGLTDTTPSQPLDMVVALADKLDTLITFFAIGEKPTGSKDPFALRRAALGVIRIILDNRLRLPLAKIVAGVLHDLADHPGIRLTVELGRDVEAELLDFFADRLKVVLRDQGVRHDLIASVFELGEDDLVRLVARATALQTALNADYGANLLVAYRRASKIVAIEEKKDGVEYSGEVDKDRLAALEEKALDAALREFRDGGFETALQAENFGEAMEFIALLRSPVDAFFDRVTVNVEDPPVRANRLRLLAQIRAALDRVADFSKIEG
jgi:glycyl-tRNA synthetase beta chain